MNKYIDFVFCVLLTLATVIIGTGAIYFVWFVFSCMTTGEIR